jgi:very-short-patch-repair endonuclease
MSQIAEDVGAILKVLFPFSHIIKEHYIKYKGARLFFDFFVRDLSVLIEVQGQQHFTFNRHMHDNDVSNFRAQKKRDNLKVEYCEENKLCLTLFYYNDIITEQLVLQRILEAQNKEPICP